MTRPISSGVPVCYDTREVGNVGKLGHPKEERLIMSRPSLVRLGGLNHLSTSLMCLKEDHMDIELAILKSKNAKLGTRHYLCFSLKDGSSEGGMVETCSCESGRDPHVLED